MRKFCIFILTALLASPVFALPKGKVVSLLKGTKGVPVELASQFAVERAVKQAITHSFVTAPLPIVNLPTQPVVQFQLKASLKPEIMQPIRVLPRAQVFDFLFFDSSCKKLFLPHSLLSSEKSLYRGMKLADMAALKNLLINGLQSEKVFLHSKEIFTSSDPYRVLLYTAPNFIVDADLPVLIKMPFTPQLQKQVAWQDYDVAVFKKDIPADMISDIWVLLMVNGTPDWCKAVLKNGELVLIPGFGKFYDRAEAIQR